MKKVTPGQYREVFRDVVFEVRRLSTAHWECRWGKPAGPWIGHFKSKREAGVHARGWINNHLDGVETLNSPGPSYRSTDMEHTPELAAEIAGLRGDMTEAAEKHPLPARFDVIESLDEPAMVITDMETGRSAVIPLFAYGPVRQALNDLFGSQ